MKKMILVVVLLIGTIQGAEKKETWTVRNELQQLADGNVRILGKDKAFMDISKTIASSIRQIAEKCKNNDVVSIANATQDDLTFLEKYSSLRQNLQTNSKTTQEHVNELENMIKKLSLEELARKTVFIDALYGEKVPVAFDEAWKYQLNNNDNPVGRGRIEGLIKDGEIVDFIMAFQDQQAIIDRSNTGNFNKLDLYQETSSESSKDKKPNSILAHFKSSISNFWKHRDSFEKWTYSGFALLAVFTLYTLSRRG